MIAPSLAPADPVLVRTIGRDILARLGARVDADAAAGRPRMSADTQRRCTVALVRSAVAAHGGGSADQIKEQALEAEILRSQFGFGGLRRLLADLGAGTQIGQQSALPEPSSGAAGTGGTA